MNTRRKFLRNSGIAVSGVLAFDPLTSLAGTSSLFSSDKNGRNNTGSIVILHTNHTTAEEFARTAAGTGALAGRADNIVLVNAHNTTSGTLSQEQEARKLNTMITAGYSAALATSAELALADTQQRYAPFVLSNTHTQAAGTAVQPSRVVTKGNIKIGIIGITLQNDSANEIQQQVNSLAAGLKNNSGCKIVICLSSLGYKTTGVIDDARLAANSVNVDVIISANNATRITPHVALTNTGSEVLIDNAGSTATGVGKLEIGFDGSGNKNHVAFGSQVLSGTAASMALM